MIYPYTKYFIYLLISLFLPLVILTSPLDAEETAIYMVSQDGDKIGNDASFTLDEHEGFFDVKTIRPANSNELKGFSIIYYNGRENSWQFKFVVPARQSLKTGYIYRYAQSYPYQSLDRSGIKVCRIFEDYIDLQGEFNILDLSLGPQGEILSLAIDFKQIVGGTGFLFGSLRYHSEIPLTTDYETVNNNILYDHTFVAYTESKNNWGQKPDIISEHQPFNILQYSPSNGISVFIGDLPTYQYRLNLQASGYNNKLEKGIYFNTKPMQQTLSDAVMSFHGIGCHVASWETSGSFEILDIVYGVEGKITSLAVDFILRCKSSSSIRGSIRYNSFFPPSTEEEIKTRLE